uniref:Alkylated DNA repair protein AlkB homologue 8 N-terminal domain-containing protein n=1 Tax=Knipowitschia caucasica TaxID=637954 RepID=A0AAV2LSD2_KNICA
MYFLRQLRKAKLPAQMLVQFYTAIIESILTSSVTVWFAGATVRDKQRLQRIVRSAEEVIGRSLPSLQDLHFTNTNFISLRLRWYQSTPIPTDTHGDPRRPPGDHTEKAFLFSGVGLNAQMKELVIGGASARITN